MFEFDEWKIWWRKSPKKNDKVPFSVVFQSRPCAVNIFEHIFEYIITFLTA